LRRQLAEAEEMLKFYGQTLSDEAGPEGAILVHAPVNVEGTRDWQGRLGLRALHCGTRSYAAILEMVEGAAKHIQGRDGFWVRDAFKEASRPLSLGMQNALEPTSIEGRCSVFAAPKMIRYIARCGVPGITVVDIVNSHLQHLYQSLKPEEARMCPELEQVVLDREAIYDHLAHELVDSTGAPMPRDDVKKLVLAITYGGQFKNLCGSFGKPAPDWIAKHQRGIRALADQRAAENPELMEMLADKRDPAISLLSYQVGQSQRHTVDKMSALVPRDQHCSYERDGFVFFGRTPPKEAFEAAAGMPVTCETYMEPGELLAWVQARYPYIDWSMRSIFKAFEVRFARTNATRALQAITKEGDPKIPKNHSDFAMVAAADLEPYVYIDGDMCEVFDRTMCKHGRWLSRKTCHLKSVMRTALLDAFTPMGAQVKNGKVVYARRGDIPHQLKATDLQNTILDQVRTLLSREPSAPLDWSEQCRRFLMDAEGLVYDYEADKFIKDGVFLRLCRHLPWSFQCAEPELTWKAPAEIRDGLRAILQDVLKYWQMGDVKTRTLEGEPIAGAPLARRLRSFVEANRAHCGLLDTYIGLYDGNVDEALWKLLHKTADACAWASRCEFIYTYGPGNSGKDTEHVVSLAFFGEGARGGLSGVVGANYFVARNSQNRDAEATTSVLDSVRGMRYIANNEIPAHETFCTDSIKPLVEAEGTPMISRSMRANPTPWRPMCGLHLSSNHIIQLPEAEQHVNSGIARRLNLVRMPRVFPDTDERSLKSDIIAGKFNGELFWLTRIFYQHLKFLGGRKRMYPIPPRVRADTLDVVSGTAESKLQKWVEANCTSVRVYKDGTASSELKAKIAEKMGWRNDHALPNKLAAAGLVEKRTGTCSVFNYTAPTEMKPWPVKLLEAGGAEEEPAAASA